MLLICVHVMEQIIKVKEATRAKVVEVIVGVLVGILVGVLVMMLMLLVVVTVVVGTEGIIKVFKEVMEVLASCAASTTVVIS